MKPTILALLLLAGITSAQWLESPVLLPDTLGPLVGPLHLTWDDNPDQPRLYFGGEGGDGEVIVVDASNYKRLTRVPTGPVNGMCFSSRQRKLYTSSSAWDAVSVVDGATNQVTKCIPVRHQPTVLLYNGRNDRVYCAAESLTVIDCASDTVVSRLPVQPDPAIFAFDSGSNRMYFSTQDELMVLDCARDSIVVTIPQLGLAAGLCWNPTARKLYVAARDTLYAVDGNADTVLTAIAMPGQSGLLACDPVRNRVAAWDTGRFVGVDCTVDTLLYAVRTGLRQPLGIACDPLRGRFYITNGDYDWFVWVVDGASGELDTVVRIGGFGVSPRWIQGLDVTACVAETMMTSIVSCASDRVVGVFPNTAAPRGLGLAATEGKLYVGFSGGSGCIAVVDCATRSVSSYIVGKWVPSPSVFCWNSASRKLYATNNDTFVSVYDCAADTLLGHIPVTGRVASLQWSAAVNKIYAAGDYARNGGQPDVVNVIDCGSDSVVRCIEMGDPGLFTAFDSVSNLLWWAGLSKFALIDCAGDSVVAEATNGGFAEDVVCSPEDGKLFAVARSSPMRIVSMDDLSRVESLPTIGDQLIHLCYVPNARKVFWILKNDESTTIRVVDSRTNAISATFDVAFRVTDMCLDHTGDYMYCSGYDYAADTAVLGVIDTRRDSLVGTLQVPVDAHLTLGNAGARQVYLSSWMNRRMIAVVRDSVCAGAIEEELVGHGAPSVRPTVVRRGTGLVVSGPGTLTDVCGRRVAALRRGRNDLRGVPVGVYFLREAYARAQAQAVCKVVIMR